MKISISLILFVFAYSFLYAQSSSNSPIKVMFYNVENFFDCIDDSTTNDSEYLPGGMRGWNYDKYIQKQTNISKVIVNIGGWNPPAIIGLCEVESDKCLKDLTHYSSLKNLKYKYIHFESPDPRGVDVALLYQTDFFKPQFSKALNIKFPTSPQSKTRDILYVKGLISGIDSLHIFVCHFPSRLGGELESEEKRNFVATIVRNEIDSILRTEVTAKIIVMGDFNDYPTNKSLSESLGAKKVTNTSEPDKLYNLMYPLHLNGNGSHKINGEWGALDQIIVSGSLLSRNKLYCKNAEVYMADFLLKDDDTFLGKKPFRTYNGMKYEGGFSDHLPIFVDLYINN